MIYTITFSPSIDYVINTDQQFNANDLNRVEDYQLYPGGKGINASIILKRIGYENKAITFLNGATKNLFLDLIKSEQLDLIDFGSENPTRINIKMFSADTSFEINGAKAIISQLAQKQLLDFVEQKINPNDFVLIMGICQEAFLEELITKIAAKKIFFGLDIDSPVVLKLLKYQPFILKPNKNELSSLIKKSLNSLDEIKAAMMELKAQGLQNVLVSDGKKGSYFLDHKENFYHIKLTKKFEIISTVGAGDTLLSAFCLIYQTTNDVELALKQATSLSIGTTQTKFLASVKDLDQYLDFIEVTKIQ